MKKLLLLFIILSSQFSILNSQIYIAFLWHMHQPIYYPYENINTTQQNGRFGFSLYDIFNQRTGPYNDWPKNAVQKLIDAGFQHAGAQVSFSGSLIENLNNIESAGACNGSFTNWKNNWTYIRTQKTSLSNPRLDMVGFGYFHPLMGLIDYYDIRKQIQMHKSAFNTNFPGSYSKGIFPPENAFSLRMIPALKDEGIDWVLVDNIHFDRACLGYPFSTNGNLYEVNKADIQNPNPNDWKSLTNLWAPTPVSIKWGHTPHYVQYVDPSTAKITKMIAVPGSRYLGNEDARGGFGALQYESVMSQFESSNTDSKHPILIVLPHDGDNYGGGSDSYYGSNFDAFVSWLQINPSRFVCTTIQDYLQMFPPDTADVIHVEPGSWSGADNGDPEFLKWNGDPNTSTGYSPDRNSWGVVTAAKNIIFTADQVNSNDQNTKNAWNYMLVAESSDYWYWDGQQIWDSNPTRACNQVASLALSVAQGGTDITPPTIYLPQREPYNPGGTEWNIAMPSDFNVWTYVYDISGLTSVVLKWRTENSGIDPFKITDNKTYAGGSDVSSWQSVTMTSKYITPTTDPMPTYKANEYDAQITGQNNVLIDYYVEAADTKGNIAKSPIQHVWVGKYTEGGSGGTSGVSWTPSNPTKDDTITITVSGATQGAMLHWGVNGTASWTAPNSVYWPAGSSLYSDNKSVESPMIGPDKNKNLTIKIGPFNNAAQSVNIVAFVIHYNDNTWDNNSNKNYIININTGTINNVSWTPISPTINDVIKITVSSATQGGKLHWGVNNWIKPLKTYWPSGSILFSDSVAVETPLSGPDAGNKLTINIGPFNNTQQLVSTLAFDIHYNDNTWDNNSKLDYHIPILPITTGTNQILNPKSLILNIYPNPANHQTTLTYQLPSQSKVLIDVYDIIGNKITTLINEQKPAGKYHLTYNTQSLNPGLYFLKLSTTSSSTFTKFIKL